MTYDWEVAYVDDEKLVLRHARDKHFAPMIVCDSAQMYGWKVGDPIRVDGALHPRRELQKQMGLPLSEDDYILHNQHTETRANIRKNDFEHEDAWEWLKELQDEGKVK